MAKISMSSFANKSCPKRYKAKDAPYAVGGNKCRYLAGMPKPYPKTAQQRKIGAVAEKCGIKSGISKSALMTAMKDCVKKEFGK